MRILVAANENFKWCAENFATDNMVITATLKGNQKGDVPSEFDYYLGTTRSSMPENFPDARVGKQVARLGAVFAVVKQRQRP